MTIERVRELYHAQPFQPFVIHLNDGRQFPVPEPGSLAIAPSGRSLIVGGADDAFQWIDLRWVSDLVVEPPRDRTSTLEQFRAACNAQPFQPFIIHLAGGRQIPVGRRDLLATNPHGRTTIVVQPDDSWNVIDLSLVTDLEFQPIKSAPARRRKASGD